MTKVDPTAILDPEVELADQVEIGPGCVLRGRVVVGPGCRLLGHVYLNGPLTLGAGNRLFPFVCLGFEPQDLKFSGPTAGVVIGEYNVFRESATVHASTDDQRATAIGDHNYFMTNSHVGHDAAIASRCTLVSGALVGGHATIEDEVTLGGNAAVHQFCRVGRMSFLGGSSAITKDLPPYMLGLGINGVIGPNVVGLRRAGLPRAAVDAVRAAFRVLYVEGHSNTTAAQKIAEIAVVGGGKAEAGADAKPLLDYLAAFIKASRRGLVPWAPRTRPGRTAQQGREE